MDWYLIIMIVIAVVVGILILVKVRENKFEKIALVFALLAIFVNIYLTHKQINKNKEIEDNRRKCAIRALIKEFELNADIRSDWKKEDNNFHHMRFDKFSTSNYSEGIIQLAV
ncbi:MAG: hypothetical protein JW871_02575, partial [Endomicrobiales bacterium]|nr:hypothetical protein [Endomicrobiales bacterium]